MSMGGGVVGEATIKIGADASDVSNRLRDEKSRFVKAGADLGDSGGRAASSGFSSIFTRGIGKGLSSGLSAVGRTAGQTLVSGAKVTGGIVAGVLATSLAKGFSRLESIDTATAKLTGLGKSAKDIESIMASATNAVRGTSFGLGDAASAAASFSAAGIPLSGMERTLSILASTSAVAGASMGDMTTIFGKVAATGKLNGEVLAQLSERGVPVLSYLAEQYGVTAAEASKMVSSGKVDFETFQSVLEKNLGPAAAAIGQSFSGMLSNVGAALGRLGATAQKPIFESLKIVFPALISFLDQMNAALKPLSEILLPKFQAGAEAIAAALTSVNFEGTADGAQAFLSTLGPLAPLLGLAAGALGPLLSGLPVIGTLFAGITGPVGLFAGALIGLLAVDPSSLAAGFATLDATLPAMIERLVGSVVTAVPKIAAQLAQSVPIFANGIIVLISSLVPVVAAAIPQLITAFVTGFAGIVTALATVAPVLAGNAASIIPQVVTALLGAIPALIAAGTQLFMSLVNAIPLVIPPLLSVITSIVPQIVVALTTALPQIVAAGTQLIMSLVQAIPVVLPQILTAVMGLVTQIGTMLTTMIPALLTAGVQLLMALVSALPLVIPPLISAVLTLIPQIITTLLSALPQILSTGLDLFLQLVESVVTAAPDIISAVLDLLPQLLETIVGMIPSLISTGVELFVSLVQAMATAIPDIISAVLALLPDLISTLIGMIPTLIDAAITLFTSLVEAIPVILPELIGALIGMAPQIIGAIIGLVPQLIQAGVDLISGLVQGLLNAAGKVGATLLKIAQDAVGSFLSFLGIASPSKLFKSFGKYIGQGLVIGLAGQKADVTRTVKGLLGQVDKLYDGLKGDRGAALKKLNDYQDRLVKARGATRSKLLRDIADQRRIIAAADRILSRASKSSIDAQVRAANVRLQTLAAQRDTIAKRLEAARDRLADALQVRADYVANIRDGVFGQADASGAKTAEKYIASLTKQVEAAKAFRATIASLTSMGLSKSAISELTQGFASTGSTAAANAILAGGAGSIKQINELRGQLDAQASALGNSVADTMYKAGIDAARGLVKGLESETAALKRAADTLATQLVKSIKKQLGIKSPSRVLAGVGVNTVLGYIKGVQSLAGRAQAALGAIVPPRTVDAIGTSTAGILSDNVSRMSVPLRANGSTTTSTTNDNRRTVHATVEVQGSDPYKTSALVVDRLDEMAEGVGAA